jgi:predicted transposase YdaD
MSEPEEPAEPSDAFNARLLSHPHDALFRRTFSDPAHVEGELRAMLPQELVARIDFASLTVLPRSYVDEKLRDKESDLLLSVRMQGRPTLIYVLCEHQSRSDARMPLRLLGYLTRIWEQHAERHPRVDEALPPIVPLVLHHGRASWSAPTRLRDLFAIDEDTQHLLAPFLPDFTFVLDDLAAFPPSILHLRDALSPLAKLVLFVLQRARHAADLVAELRAFTDTVDELAGTVRGPADLAVVLRYIYYVTELPPDSLREALRDTRNPYAREAIMSTAERLLAEGEARGEIRGRAATLVKLLTFKFGPLARDIEARIYGATVVELDQWTERVLDAASLEDVLH